MTDLKTIPSAWPQKVPIVDGQYTIPSVGTWMVWWEWLDNDYTLVFAPNMARKTAST